MFRRRAHNVSIQLASEPLAPRTARAAVRKALGATDRAVVERAMLMTSELVTNAVVHAATAVKLDVRVDRGVLRVVVEDGDRGQPVLSTTSGAHGGFGLHIVEQLADAWGSAPRDHGKVVWFELALPKSRNGASPAGDLQNCAN